MDSVFASLYFVPVHAGLAVVLGGIIYYMFPYVLLVIGGMIVTIWMCSPTHQELSKALKIPSEYPSLILGYGLASIGVAAVTSYFKDDDDPLTLLITVSVLLPLSLGLIYVSTSRSTMPAQVMAQMGTIRRR